METHVTWEGGGVCRPGGDGGRGGKGGAAIASDSTHRGCNAGRNGPSGRDGTSGRRGRTGQPGPHPQSITVAGREVFGDHIPPALADLPDPARRQPCPPPILLRLRPGAGRPASAPTAPCSS